MKASTTVLAVAALVVSASCACLGAFPYPATHVRSSSASVDELRGDARLRFWVDESARAAPLHGPMTPRTWTRHPNIREDPRPLFTYVAEKDPAYGWVDTGERVSGTFPAPWTGVVLNLTSQNWLTPADVDRTLWTHQLVVITPEQVDFTDTVSMYITGGGANAPPPTNTSEDLFVSAFLATTTNSVTATLFQVPNAPLVFSSDPQHKPRSEDHLLAWGFHEYMQHQTRPEWVPLLPMAKSAVSAMDALTDYNKQRWGYDVTKFLVAGASKRGWTTWLTGVVDERAFAIAPIVFDMLNFEKGVAHTYQDLGGWTFAFEPYWVTNLTTQIGTENFAALAAIIDPLQYKEYLTMPKLVIDATGDEFFAIDDDIQWWGQLPGDTYRLMVDNAEHSMATGLPELLTGVDAFALAMLTGSDVPSFDWSIDTNGTGRITLTTSQKPDKVVLRFATTTDGKRRDFRLVKGNTPADPCKFIPIKLFGGACINPVIWVGETIAPESDKDGVYTFVGDQPLPPDGWRAFLLEVYYPGPRGSSFRLTTQASIIPNTLPFPPCGSGQSCKGVLV